MGEEVGVYGREPFSKCGEWVNRSRGEVGECGQQHFSECGEWAGVVSVQQIWGVGEKGVSGEVGEWSGVTPEHVGE